MSSYNLLPWKLLPGQHQRDAMKAVKTDCQSWERISLTSPLGLEQHGSFIIYSEASGKKISRQTFSWKVAGFKVSLLDLEDWTASYLFFRKRLMRQGAGYGVGLWFANSLQIPQSLLLPGLKAALHRAKGDLNFTQQTSWLWWELLKVHVRAVGLDRKKGKSGGGYYIPGCKLLARERMRCE